MGVRWVERFQVYVLNVGNLAAGASVIDLPLPLDSDAPFVLRGRGGRCKNDPQFFQAGMNGLLTQFRDPNGYFRSDAPVPWWADIPGGGYGGQWKPVYPEFVYPQQTSLLTSVYNTGPGAVNLTNVQLYYVGVKRYPATSPWLTYPKKCSTREFIYNYWSVSPTQPNLSWQNSPIKPNDSKHYIPITIATDADFVLRSAQAGIYGTNAQPVFYMELFITLYDQWRKSFMNAPVHIDWLMGGGSRSFVGTEAAVLYPNNTESIFQSQPAPSIANAPVNGLPTGILPGQVPLSGNWHPGLFYPELYCPANSQFFFDLLRQDAGYTTAYGAPNSDTTVIVPQNINLNIAFRGSKVYHR